MLSHLGSDNKREKYATPQWTPPQYDNGTPSSSLSLESPPNFLLQPQQNQNMKNNYWSCEIEFSIYV